MKQAMSNAFEKIGLGAGVLLKSYTGVEATDLADTNIVCATRAGATLTVPQGFRNITVDGVKTNTVESYVSDGYTPTLAFTAITQDADSVKLALGAADIVDGEIIPRHEVKSTDFKTYYWYGEKSNGGRMVATFMNCISTGGLNWKSNDKGEWESSITLTANYTAEDQDTVPFKMKDIASV